MNRLVLDIYKKKKEKVFCCIIYDSNIKNFITIQNKNSQYYEDMISGNYNTAFLPFILSDLNKKEISNLLEILNTGKDANRKLLKDKNLILKYIPSCPVEESLFLPTIEDSHRYYNSKEIIWKTTSPIKEKKILLNGKLRYVYYYMVVINGPHKQCEEIKLSSDKNRFFRNYEDQIMKVFYSMKNIKITKDSDVINKAKFIRDYIGEGSYTILENGNIIVISNNYTDCMIEKKLSNLSSMYGKKFHYHTLKTEYGNDLVIQLFL